MGLAADVNPEDIGGLVGWVAGVIDALGPLGVGLLIALENLVPPIPSEVVLPLAGAMAGEGGTDLVIVVLAATAGSVGGALALYWLGAAVGEERLRRWLDHIPLVERADLDKADRWFERYGRWAVLLGRMVPVVRSLVSIPAGANRMPLGQFTVLTSLGSSVWNSVFVGLGFALGSQWPRVSEYSDWLNNIVLAVFAVIITTWVVKRIRRRRRRNGLESQRAREAAGQ